MRLLVVSNVPGSVDKLLDIIKQRGNIVAKETGATVNTIAQTVGEEIRNGTYDQAIVVARDPISAGMLLNKQDGVNAAVCNSVEDVQLARDNEANVMVIRDVRSSQIEDIIEEMLASGGVMSKIKLGKATQAAPRREEEREEKKAKASRPAKQKEEMEEEAEEGEESSGSSGRKDMVGKLKDYLGIT